MMALLGFVVIARVGGIAEAQVPDKINYQGMLTTPDGQPVNAAVSIVFKLYNTAAGGSALYAETQTVAVSNGVFNAVIGAATPLLLPFDVPYYLGVTVGADPEMTPRQPVLASPFALQAAEAEDAQRLGGQTLAGLDERYILVGGTVAGAQITGALTSATLPAGNVTGTIGTAQLANNAVTQAKLSPASGGTAGKVLGTDGTNLVWQSAAVAGTVTSVSTGTGLSAIPNPITGSGTINLATTQLLPTVACATNQIPKWIGGAWTCAADATGSGSGVAAVTATLPLASSGGTTPNISLSGAIPVASGGTGQTALAVNGILYGQGTGAVGTTVGSDGQVLAGSPGAPQWTGSPSLSGNLTLVGQSTGGAGNIMKGTTPFMHNYGENNTFIGENAGNFTMTGGDNIAGGVHALQSNTTGSGNTATGSGALHSNASGYANTGIGNAALTRNTGGWGNTALGSAALYGNTTGLWNIAVGSNAGHDVTTGSNNILIGNVGVSLENSTIRIGDANQIRTVISGIRGVTPEIAGAIPVVIDSNGQLGTVPAFPGGGVSRVAAGTGLAATPDPITSTGIIGIANGGVGTTQIADLAVSGAKLANSAVSGPKLADGAVTAFKIADGNVTFPKLESTGCSYGYALKWMGAGGWQCQPDLTSSGGGTVTAVVAGSGLATEPSAGIEVSGAVYIPEGGVRSFHLADGAVTTEKLSGAGCSNGQVLKWSGTAWVCADDNGGSATGSGFVQGGNLFGALPGDTAILGTIDGNALSVIVNNTRALRIEPTDHGVPNLIGGHPNNRSGVAGIYGATVAGGGDAGTCPVYLDGAFMRSCANGANAYFATIGGGASNWVDKDYGTVAGGGGNTVIDYWGTVGGGTSNRAGQHATVAGGAQNDASASRSTIGGGLSNKATGWGATVAGGETNDALGKNATIGGGAANEATLDYATVAGGWFNSAKSTGSTIAGGLANEATAEYATLAGGRWNSATGPYSSVSGGYFNASGGMYASISGGYMNAADGEGSVISGGIDNRAKLEYATVGGGRGNIASTAYETIGGGADNVTEGGASTVGGGRGNAAKAGHATVGGGGYNEARGEAATVAGGWVNAALGDLATVSGGWSNSATGRGSVVPGGLKNVAEARNTFAAGAGAYALAEGSFVWADSPFFSTNPDEVLTFYSHDMNEFAVRATGGVRLVTGIDDETGDPTWTCSINGGGGSWWACSSDRNLKTDLVPLIGTEVLERLAALPVYRWVAKGDRRRIPHAGPTAQDFMAAFGLGDNDKMIGFGDVQGVALAAIQGLRTRQEEQKATMMDKDAQIATQQQRIADLEDRVAQVESLRGELAALKQALAELRTAKETVAARSTAGPPVSR
jgi:hypothetical protein